MRPEELRGLEDQAMLFIHHNRPPAILKMTPFFKHFTFKRRATLSPAELPTGDMAVSYLPLEAMRPEPPQEEPEADDGTAREAREKITAVLAPPEGA